MSDQTISEKLFKIYPHLWNEIKRTEQNSEIKSCLKLDEVLDFCVGQSEIVVLSSEKIYLFALNDLNMNLEIQLDEKINSKAKISFAFEENSKTFAVVD